MARFLISIVGNALISTIVFAYLVFKAKIHRKYIYTDNVFIILFVTVVGSVLYAILGFNSFVTIAILNALLVIFCIVCLTLIRFYRNPDRQHNATDADFLSPADGFVIYIKKLQKGNTPFSVKGRTISELQELTKTSLLETPCWLIGITMTLFDVHVTRAPTNGSVILNEHFHGKYLSLKKGASEIENERNTIVLQNAKCQVGVVQIASRRVRGIKSYIEREQYIEKGQRMGAIRFGSQTDIILPDSARINVQEGQWVFGGKTVVATLNTNEK